MIVIFAYITVCAAGKDLVDGKTDPIGAFFNWFHDPTLLLNPRIEFAMCVAITDGFLVFDWYVLQFMFATRSKVNDQMIAHHVMAFGGFTGCMLAGYSLPGISVASLLCETSSIFLNYKDMFSKETRDSALAEINQLTFFVTYNIFRMALFPYLIYGTAYDTYTTWNYRGNFQKGLAIYCNIQCTCVYLLNVYWYALIIKGLKRMLQGKGILAKASKEEFDELAQYE